MTRAARRGGEVGSAAELDAALAALADPARRAVVERLRAGPTRAGDLARELAMSAPRMSQHLRALRRGGLVEETGFEDDARVRLYQLRPERFTMLRGWAEGIESFWAGELQAFARYAAQRRRGRR